MTKELTFAVEGNSKPDEVAKEGSDAYGGQNGGCESHDHTTSAKQITRSVSMRVISMHM